jgi:hypothetical protein
MAKKFLFFHNLETIFKPECLAIIPFALWDIVCLENEDYISRRRVTLILEMVLQAF